MDAIRPRKRALSHVYSSVSQPVSPAPTDSLLRAVQTPITLRTPSDSAGILSFLRGNQRIQELEDALTASIGSIIALRVSYKLFEAGETVNLREMREFAIVVEGAACVRKEYEAWDVGPGDAFGTLKLGKWSEAEGMMKFKEDTHCAVIPESEIPYIRQQLKSHMYKFLRSLPIFSRVPHSSLSTLLSKSVTIRLNQNTVVFRAGEKVTDVYIVREGEVKLIEDIAIRQRGRNTELMMDRKGRSIQVETILGPGELIGEETPSAEAVRRQTCVCRSQVVFLLRIPLQDFLAVDSKELWDALNHRNEVKQALHHKRREGLEGETKSNNSESPQRSPDRSSESRSRSYSKFDDIHSTNPLLKQMLEQIVAHSPVLDPVYNGGREKSRKRGVMEILRTKKRGGNTSVDYSQAQVKSLTRISGRGGIKRNALSVHDILLKRMLTNGPKALAVPQPPSGENSMMSDVYPLPRPQRNIHVRGSSKIPIARRNLLKGLAVL